MHNMIMYSYKPNLTWNDHIDVIILNSYIHLYFKLNRLKHFTCLYLQTLHKSQILSQKLWQFSLFHFIGAILIGLRPANRPAKFNAHTGPIFKSLFLLELEHFFINFCEFYYRHILRHISCKL